MNVLCSYLLDINTFCNTFLDASGKTMLFFFSHCLPSFSAKCTHLFAYIITIIIRDGLID